MIGVRATVAPLQHNVIVINRAQGSCSCHSGATGAFRHEAAAEKP